MSVLVNGKEKYDVTELLKKEPNRNVYMIQGGRNIGKSYSVKSYCYRDAYMYDDRKTAYMRRRGEDLKRQYVESYFNGLCGEGMKQIKECTNGEYSVIIPYRGKLYFGNYKENEKGELKDYKGKVFGMTIPINLHERYKSGQFTSIANGIYEEWQSTNGAYLPDEPKHVRNIVSTIERDKKMKLFMIANLITPISPYVKDWHLTGCENMKPGEISVYSTVYQTEQGTMESSFDVVVQMCSEEDKKSFFVTKKGKLDNVASNQYQFDEYPTFDFYNYEKFTTVFHTVVFAWDNFRFLMRLCKCFGEIFWYVEPKTTEIKNNTRIVSNVYYPSNLYSNSFTPFNEKESIAFNYLKIGKVKFSSDLCGTTFNTALRQSKFKL